MGGMRTREDMGTKTGKDDEKACIPGIESIVQQDAIWRNTRAGQWARTDLQMGSSLARVARFQKRGEKPGGGFMNAARIFNAWQWPFRCLSRGGEGGENRCMRGIGLRACRLKCQHR